MHFDRFALEDALGAVLAHGIKAGEVVLRKGRRLSSEDIEHLSRAGLRFVVATQFKPATCPSDAAARLAALAAGGR